MSDLGRQKLWTWFGLSRASWLIMPRVLMHQMPDEWQSRMTDLLEEMEDGFPNWTEDDLHVTARRDGKFKRLDPALCEYRRPIYHRIAEMARGPIRESLMAHVQRVKNIHYEFAQRSSTSTN